MTYRNNNGILTFVLFFWKGAIAAVIGNDYGDNWYSPMYGSNDNITIPVYSVCEKTYLKLSQYLLHNVTTHLYLNNEGRIELAEINTYR